MLTWRHTKTVAIADATREKMTAEDLNISTELICFLKTPKKDYNEGMSVDA